MTISDEKIKEIREDLNNLENEVEDAKKNVAIKEGRFAENLRQLKDDFNVNSVEEAREKKSEHEEEFTKLEEGILQKYSRLKANYSW